MAKRKKGGRKRRRETDERNGQQCFYSCNLKLMIKMNIFMCCILYLNLPNSTILTFHVLLGCFAHAQLRRCDIKVRVRGAREQIGDMAVLERSTVSLAVLLLMISGQLPSAVSQSTLQHPHEMVHGRACIIYSIVG